MRENKKVLEYAKKMGYESAYFRLEWKGYNVYQPVYSDEFSYIGLPLMILEKDGKIRMTDVDEAFEILDITADEDELVEKETEKNNVVKDSLFDKVKNKLKFNNYYKKNTLVEDSNFFNKVLYFFKRGNKSIPVKEKDSEEDIYNRKEYAKSFGISDENAELIAKYGVLDENGMPMILYRGSTVSPKDDNGGNSVLCPDKKVFCLSDKEYKAVGHGLVHRYFLISKKPYFVNKIKDTQKEFVNGNYDVAISKGNGEDVEYTSKNKENLILID